MLILFFNSSTLNFSSLTALYTQIMPLLEVCGWINKLFGLL